MCSYVTKEQTADCQMVEDSITYAWNLLYVVLAGNRQGRQSAQKEVRTDIKLHLAQDWFHGNLGAGCGGWHIAERLLMEYCTEMGPPMAPSSSGRARHSLRTTFCPSGVMRKCSIAVSILRTPGEALSM